MIYAARSAQTLAGRRAIGSQLAQDQRATITDTQILGVTPLAVVELSENFHFQFEKRRANKNRLRSLIRKLTMAIY